MIHMSVQRWFRTPKALLIVVLAFLVAIAGNHEGWRVIGPGLGAAILFAGAADALILRYRRGRWEFPDGAILTAMLVAMVLSAHQPWHQTAITAVVGILSKYVLRTKQANIFNPAALGIVATFYVFGTGQSWWGALPAAPAFTLIVLLVLGVFIADRVNKMPLVLSFLGLYYLLFTATSFLVEPGQVAEVFRTPDVQAALFFAFFILDDPPTSPITYRDQIICGTIVAVVSFAVFVWIGAVYYLLAGVLVGNVWEAWRRVAQRRSRRIHSVPAH